MVNENRNINLAIHVLLVLSAIATTAYLLVLGWFNTLSLDDYGFASQMSVFTPWEWTKHMYMTWQGRFSDFFISGFIFKCFSGNATWLFPWTVIQLLIGYAVVYLCVRDVMHVHNKGMAITLTVLLNNICILSVLELSTFYWLCCAAYFLEAYATILLFYVLFVPKWNKYVRIIVAMLSALFISGCAENYTPLVLMVLGIIWLYQIVVETRQSSFVKAFKSQWLLFSVCAILLVGFLAMMLAPGNEVRMLQEGRGNGYMHDFHLGAFIKTSIIANVIYMLRLVSRGFYWLGALAICMYVGKLMRDNQIAVNIVKLGKKIGIATGLLIGFIVVAITSCVYGIGYYPPLRSMSFMSYVIMAYIAYVGCLLGYCLSEQKPMILNGLCVIATIGWLAFAGVECYKDFPEAKRYHTYVEQRDAQIQQLVEEGNTERCYVEGYYPVLRRNSYSYLRTAINKCVGSKKVVNEPYYPYMISIIDRTNPGDFKNKGLGDYYHANFEILEK